VTARAARAALPLALAVALPLLTGCASPPSRTAHDVVIRGGTVYDGTGAAGVIADVAISRDRVVAVAPRVEGTGALEVDARGFAVAPGFINMLSWSNESLIADGRAQSAIRQGVTLEVMGEGWSMGPLSDAMKRDAVAEQGHIRYDVQWTTLGEYLQFLERRGVSPNVASMVGATTVRQHVLGDGDVDPDAAQLATMRALVRTAMQEGAVGLGSALIYAPGSFAETAELVALSTEVARCNGLYASHMRSEGDRLLESIDEVLEIAQRSGVRAEIYHLKAAGWHNWSKMPQALGKLEAARQHGLPVAANMYVYTAGGTDLHAAMPPWAMEGGRAAMLARLRDPATRERITSDMSVSSPGWENLFLHAGPEGTRIAGVVDPALKPLIGRTIASIAAERGVTPEVAIMDIVLQDEGRSSMLVFLMSEENVERVARTPWVTLGADAAASAPEGVFLKSSTHPRAYGNFARFLGHYVRERNVDSLESAIHRLTGLPAQRLALRERGLLAPGAYADVVVFDPAAIRDHATFEQPMQYATGVRDVFVNGTAVLRDGEHTGAKPGRVVRGPGWTGWPAGGACGGDQPGSLSQIFNPIAASDR
jgi:N-acyl-D-amino-acid deacylase